MTVRASDAMLPIGWYALDQLTKLAAVRLLDGPVVLVDRLFALTLSHNTGALFGIMADWNAPARFLLLTAVPAIATAAIAVVLVRTPREQILARIGLGSIVGGAAGNLTDRIARGHVIDFLDAYCGYEPVRTWLADTFGTYHWPTFNVADVALTLGAALLVIHLFRHRSGDHLAPRAD